MTHQSLGVCYYPEHWPETYWRDDAEKMALLGIKFVRIGEFAWSRLEPAPGQYDFDWLARALNILSEAGLKVVLGTPTATPPKWLIARLPDMIPIDGHGRPRNFGSRRHYCFSHAAYVQECARIVTKIAESFGEHPGVAAWQTDNEYGCHDTVESYSPAAREAFQRWCARKYQTISALNQAWGNVFWSMELSDFNEIDLPNLTVTEANPSHLLDFQRFSSDQVVQFNRIQAEIIRSLSPGRPIIHNFMGAFTAFDHFKLSLDLDIASWDSYPLGFLERSAHDPDFKNYYMRIGDPDFQAFHHDLYRGCGRGRWWVMEQQPGAVNWAPWNPTPSPGAVRLWTHEAFACGAETVSYFRWRQAPFAQEQMHEGLLLPDSSPNQAFHEVAQVSHELTIINAEVATKRAPIALVFDYESDWAWKIEPQGQDFSYFELVRRFYSCLRKLGLSIDIIPPDAQAAADREIIFAPGLFHASEDFTHAIKQSQAFFVAGPRTGSKTKNFHIPENLPPGALQQLLDISIARVESLRPGTEISFSNGGKFKKWREFLKLGDHAEVILSSIDDEAAFVRCGKSFYLAGWPDETLLLELIQSVLSHTSIERLALPDDIRVRDNGATRYFFNYGQNTVNIEQLIGNATILIGGSQLEPYGVTIIRLS